MALGEEAREMARKLAEHDTRVSASHSTSLVVPEWGPELVEMLLETAAVPKALYAWAKQPAAETVVLSGEGEAHRHVLAREVVRFGFGWLVELPTSINEYSLTGNWASHPADRYYMEGMLVGVGGEAWNLSFLNHPQGESAASIGHLLAVHTKPTRTAYDPVAPKGHELCPVVHVRPGLEPSDAGDYWVFGADEVRPPTNTPEYLRSLREKFVVPFASLLVGGHIVVTPGRVSGDRIPVQ